MTVVFRLTQRDLWRFHQHAKHRRPLIAVLRLASVPLFFFLMAYFGGFGLAGSMTVLVLSALLPLLAFGLMLLDMRRDVRRDAANVSGRIAEIGKFDFRWGSPTKDGYYYHWSYFAAIADRTGLPEVYASKRAAVPHPEGGVCGRCRGCAVRLSGAGAVGSGQGEGAL